MPAYYCSICGAVLTDGTVLAHNRTTCTAKRQPEPPFHRVPTPPPRRER